MAGSADARVLEADAETVRWRADRVRDLMAQMSLDEKVAQLIGLWDQVGTGGEVVAPFQDSMQTEVLGFSDYARDGLGQITRHFGTTPIDPADGALSLREKQRWLVENTRLGIPAIVHEECLTGFAAWRASAFPVPPAWGASFDPPLVARMAVEIGRQMRGLGVHQGLAPVLDVIRDMRWGRVEECIAEDPYLVGMIGGAYVEGLQSTGIVATLKHFVGYSDSRAGRNLAPVHAGRRELLDVLLVPFEMAVRDSGARSVMNSYSEIDGVPVAADESLLTDLLRDEWGFEGTVVADYFAIAFLTTLHNVAADAGEAAALALRAGIDIELPTGVAYREPLVAAVREGPVPEALVDRALYRVLRQKAELGLLDPDPLGPDPLDGDAGSARVDLDAIDLDPPGAREVARTLAEESVVLLHNNGVLPLRPQEHPTIAVVGPNADRASALFGCYAFANHVLPQHPGVELGIRTPTILDALRDRFAGSELRYERGCDVESADTSGFEAAAHAAEGADVVVAVLGDQSGLFGRGTSGEGCDAESLSLPGVQRALLERLLATGVPVVVVLVTGRGYEIEWAVPSAAGLLQAFFPGEEGGAALARILAGDVNPSGRLPMSLPRSPGSAPYSYLHPRLGATSSVSNVRTEPAFPFGAGLSYTAFEYSDFEVAEASVATDGSIDCAVTVRNAGTRDGAEVVQLYARDVVASTTRPLCQLVGFHRVSLAAGEAARVRFHVPTRRISLIDVDFRTVVEPGEVTMMIGRSSSDVVAERAVHLVGDVHVVSAADARRTQSTEAPAS